MGVWGLIKSPLCEKIISAENEIYITLYPFQWNDHPNHSVYLETTYQHLQGLDKDSRRKAKARAKDPRLKAKARTKDYKFVLKDNQRPRPRTTSLAAR